jgi:hypothetical protein
MFRPNLRPGAIKESCGSGKVWRGGVLEFLDDEDAGDLRAGAVLPDEVYLL